MAIVVQNKLGAARGRGRATVPGKAAGGSVLIYFSNEAVMGLILLLVQQASSSSA